MPAQENAKEPLTGPTTIELVGAALKGLLSEPLSPLLRRGERENGFFGGVPRVDLLPSLGASARQAFLATLGWYDFILSGFRLVIRERDSNLSCDNRCGCAIIKERLRWKYDVSIQTPIGFCQTVTFERVRADRGPSLLRRWFGLLRYDCFISQ